MSGSSENRNKQNDSSRELDVLGMMIGSLYVSLAIGTFILAPLSMIYVHLKFEEPYSKITAILGAVLAVGFLQAPLSTVVVCFIFGLVCADAIFRRNNFWASLGKGLASTILVGVGFVSATAYSSGLTVGSYWSQLVTSFFTVLKDSASKTASEPGVSWEVLQNTVLYEGPFLIVSGLILSYFLSVGFAAHLGWFKKSHPLSSLKLRKLRLPTWVSFLFLVVFLRAASLEEGSQMHMYAGLSRILGSLLFIQGFICLSDIFHRRRIKPRVRSVLYVLSLLVGFYAVIGLGAIAPLYFRKLQVADKLGGNHEGDIKTDSRQIG